MLQLLSATCNILYFSFWISGETLPGQWVSMKSTLTLQETLLFNNCPRELNNRQNNSFIQFPLISSIVCFAMALIFQASLSLSLDVIRVNEIKRAMEILHANLIEQTNRLLHLETLTTKSPHKEEAVLYTAFPPVQFSSWDLCMPLTGHIWILSGERKVALAHKRPLKLLMGKKSFS